MKPFKGITKYIRSACLSENNTFWRWRGTSRSEHLTKEGHVENSLTQNYHDKIAAYINKKKAETANICDTLALVILSALSGNNFSLRTQALPSLIIDGEKKQYNLLDDSILMFANNGSLPKEAESYSAGPDFDSPYADAVLASIKIERVNNLLPLAFFKQIHAAIGILAHKEYANLVFENRQKRRSAKNIGEYVQNVGYFDQQVLDLIERTRDKILKCLPVSPTEVATSRLYVNLQHGHELRTDHHILVLDLADTLPPTKKLSKEQVLQAHKEIVKYLTNNDEFFNTVAKYMEYNRIRLTPPEPVKSYLHDHLKKTLDIEHEDYFTASNDRGVFTEDEFVDLQKEILQCLGRIGELYFKK